MPEENRYDRTKSYLRRSLRAAGEGVEIDPQDIKPEARLYEDLELDSIDAIDMIVHLQKKIGKKIKPEDFKTVRTVQDVVDAADRLLKEA